MSHTVSVVIPVLNAGRTLGRTLDSLQGQHLPLGWEQEILVVDNGSSDDSVRIAEEHRACILKCLIAGPGAARNEGIRHARGDVVVFIDGDARPARNDFLMEVLDVLLRHPETGAVGGPILPDPEGQTSIGVAEHMVAFFFWHGRRPEGPFPFFQPTANLSVRREVLERTGGFREDLLNLEEMELCDRIRATKRWHLYFNPRAVVYHRTRSRIGSAARHLFGYGVRHLETFVRLRPAARYPSPDDPLALAAYFPRLVVRRTRVVLREWLHADPRRTIPLIPWIILMASVWAFGVVVGGVRNGRRNLAGTTGSPDREAASRAPRSEGSPRP